MFKIEVEDGKGRWSDVRGDDGNVLTFESESAARASYVSSRTTMTTGQNVPKALDGKRSNQWCSLSDRTGAVEGAVACPK